MQERLEEAVAVKAPTTAGRNKNMFKIPDELRENGGGKMQKSSVEEGSQEKNEESKDIFRRQCGGSSHSSKTHCEAALDQ